MKRESIFRKVLAIAGCAAVIGAVDVGVSYAASATAATNGTVVIPIGITNQVSLQFGKFLPGVGTVTVAAEDGVRTGGVPALLAGGTVTAASFTVTGEPNATYAITLPPTFDLSDGTNTMAVDAFESFPATTGTLTAGTQTVKVGARVTVGAGQPAGVYTNAAGLAVTVEYN